MEYCFFWYLKNAIWTPLLSRCIYEGGRSHARGVAKVRNVIPMLRGKHFFFWFPCSVGMRFLLFSTPLRWECSKNCFSENSQMIWLLFDVVLVMCRACRRLFFDELRKCASHPAWRSRFGFHLFIAGLLRWESLQACMLRQGSPRRRSQPNLLQCMWAWNRTHMRAAAPKGAPKGQNNAMS